MVIGAQRVTRHLYAIGRTDQALKISRTELDIVCNQCGHIGVALNQGRSVPDRCRTLIDVGHNSPTSLSTLGERKCLVDEIRASSAQDFLFVADGSARSKLAQLV